MVTEASRALSIAMRKVAPSILTWGQIASYVGTELQRKVSSGKVATYKPRFTECLEHFLIHAGVSSGWAASACAPTPQAVGAASSLNGSRRGHQRFWRAGMAPEVENRSVIKRRLLAGQLSGRWRPFWETTEPHACVQTLNMPWFVCVCSLVPGGAKVLDGIGKELLLDEEALEPSRAVLHDYGNVSSSTTWYTLGYVESVRGAKKGDRLLQIGVGSGIKCGVNVWRAVRDIHDVQVRRW